MEGGVRGATSAAHKLADGNKRHISIGVKAPLPKDPGHAWAIESLASLNDKGWVYPLALGAAMFETKGI